MFWALLATPKPLRWGLTWSPPKKPIYSFSFKTKILFRKWGRVDMSGCSLCRNVCDYVWLWLEFGTPAGVHWNCFPVLRESEPLKSLDKIRFACCYRRGRNLSQGSPFSRQSQKSVSTSHYTNGSLNLSTPAELGPSSGISSSVWFLSR